MRAIPTLLQLLDCDWADDARLTFRDLRSLGIDLKRSETGGVLTAAGTADRVAASCDFCSFHDVVCIEEDREPTFHEVCPYGEGGLLEPSEVQTWEVNPAGIANELATAMEQGSGAETLLPNLAWRIGTLSVGGEPFSVVFATAHGASRLTDRRDASRMIVVGNRVSHDAFAGTLAIDDVFDFAPDAVSLKPDRLRQAVPLSGQPTGNAFHRKGQMWVVRFNGEEVYLENNVGPLYIARLLATPHRAVPAMTLLASRAGIDERKLTGSSGELADAQAIAECRGRYEELMAEIAEAESHHDVGRLDQLKTEQDELTSHLASVLGKGGKRREVTDADKIRQSVTKAIKRTLDVLQREHPSLAEHFDASLSLGYAPTYAPASDPAWQT